MEGKKGGKVRKREREGYMKVDNQEIVLKLDYVCDLQWYMLVIYNNVTWERHNIAII